MQVNFVRYYKYYLYRIFISTQPVLSLARTKFSKPLSPWTQNVLASRPLLLSNHEQVSSIEARPKAFEDVFFTGGQRGDTVTTFR
jgi:hypothetical protein